MEVSKKEQINEKIWKLAEEHRSSIDGWELKNYILTFFFYKTNFQLTNLHLINTIKNFYIKII